jgi:N-methylhydantoinase A/oxoprolinase/acetone carboxylase beta subunit
MPRRAQTLSVAIDTGGTFTDCVWMEQGRLKMLKVFSTPADPSQAIVEILRKIGYKGDLILLHGTTVGTNTLLERKGARTALVTTASKTPLRSDARPAPSSTISSSIASNLWCPLTSASV